MDMPPELDPRRPIVEVMARIGRETQLTIDEREQHFKITDTVIAAISVLLIILGVFNIYFVRVLYDDLDNIVATMESMVTKLNRVDKDMVAIADRIDAFDQHMQHMAPITGHVTSVTGRLPRMREDMVSMALNMQLINRDMVMLRGAVGSITPSMVQMTGNISLMRRDVHQISKPMGSLNPIMP